MTEIDLMNLPIGTPVRIVNCKKCHPAYRRGGTLIHWRDPLEDLNPFGIYIEQFDEPGDSGVCYSFKDSQYEVILNFKSVEDVEYEDIN